MRAVGAAALASFFFCSGAQAASADLEEALRLHCQFAPPTFERHIEDEATGDEFKLSLWPSNRRAWNCRARRT
ncbi:hypothetical protein C6Y62_16025 [Hyphomicrobium sulfonivorans]|nr:hypothetical protein [Hyphomicrobium sulfonivorans]